MADSIAKLLQTAIASIASVGGAAVAGISKVGTVDFVTSSAEYAMYYGDWGVLTDTTDHLDISSETVAVGGTMSAVTGQPAGGAIGTSTDGYRVCGYNRITSVDKYDLSTSVRSLGPTFPVGMQSGACSHGDGTDGWHCGGYTGTRVSSAYSLTYSSDTWTLVAGAALTVSRQIASGNVANATESYFVGGNTSGNVCDILNHSSQTTAAGTPPGSSVYGYGSIGNNVDRLWLMSNAFVADNKLVTRYDTSSNTPSSVGNVLVTARHLVMAFSASSSHGFTVAGAAQKTAEKFDYSSETSSLVAGADALQNRELAGCSTSVGF